jgi:hypothetical protein
MIQLIWDRSTVRLRPVLVVLALVGTLGCNSSDELSEITEPASTPEITGAAPVGSLPSFASSFRGGIPFGTWALPTSEFGPVYNGAMRNIWPPHLLEELAAIKARGGKVVLELAGPEWYYQDRNGYFSLSMWKERVNRFKGVDFTSYLEDGTIIGHYMIDEPNDPRNWNNRPVEGPMLEQMAAYSKQLWPKMTTIVRAKPTYMGKWGTIYRHLDAAWAQWWTISGDPADYIRREVAEAQKLGLALITGMNIRKGGPNNTNLDPDIARSAGSALLAEEYPCAFISWEYDEAYLGRADVKAVMAHLSQKAANHSTRSCSGAKTAPPPPPSRPTAPPPPPSLPGITGISLRGERVTEKGKQLVHLRWAGAAGAYMKVYRNGVSRRTTPNDGFARDYPQRVGSHTYKICEARSSRCSNSITVTIRRSAR